jgi:predicted nucleic acid-binding protein
VILSTAAEAGYHLQLSEDLHEGFTLKGITVTNPFFDPQYELLADLLAAT